MEPQYQLSLKEKIVAAIAAQVETMQAGLPLNNPYDFAFGVVQRESLDPSNKGASYCIAIYDQDETKAEDMYPFVRATIHLTCELLVNVDSDENPSTKMNMVLSNVYRRLMEDQTFGGLAIDMTFTRTEQNIGGRDDQYIEGAMFFDVTYKHHILDDRKFPNL